MMTIFNKDIAAVIIMRINALTPERRAQWGKMDAFQMLKHCTMTEEMFQGRHKYKRLFIGYLFGNIALKGILKDDKPMKKNQPTHSELKIRGSGNFEAERVKWIESLMDYDNYANGHFVHPFFGKMTVEQVGQYVYKHADHHLRQFNC